MQLSLKSRSTKAAGFTLAEVVIASALAAMSMAGIIYGYIQSAKFAEFTSYSLAAQSMAMQRVEQCRASKWDPLGYPPVDELVVSNFAAQVNILDLPISGSNIVYATNFTVITTLATNPPLKMIRVDCVWPFLGRGLFTNSTLTYRAPDQ